MSDLFVSDLHLQSNEPHLLDLFEVLMSDLAPRADRLFILGDLFEVWIGDDGADEIADTVANRLSDYADAGGVSYFMAGNRDFLIGQEYARRAQMRLLKDPATMTLPDGRVALLSHGDRFCLNDDAYAAFYQQVRDPRWQSGFLAQPLEERIAYAKQARAASAEHGKRIGEQEAIGDVDCDDIEQLMSERGVSTLIHGHTHRPAIHLNLETEVQANRIVLPDFREQGGALWADVQGLRFEEFSAG